MLLSRETWRSSGCLKEPVEWSQVPVEWRQLRRMSNWLEMLKTLFSKYYALFSSCFNKEFLVEIKLLFLHVILPIHRY